MLTQTQKAWGGRFAEATHQLVEAFTASIAIDQRLGAHDVQASIALAEMLGAVGLISPEEAATLRAELLVIGEKRPGVMVIPPPLWHGAATCGDWPVDCYRVVTP